MYHMTIMWPIKGRGVARIYEGGKIMFKLLVMLGVCFLGRGKKPPTSNG